MPFLTKEQIDALRTCVDVADPGEDADETQAEIMEDAHQALNALEEEPTEFVFRHVDADGNALFDVLHELGNVVELVFPSQYFLMHTGEERIPQKVYAYLRPMEDVDNSAQKS